MSASLALSLRNVQLGGGPGLPGMLCKETVRPFAAPRKSHRVEAAPEVGPMAELGVALWEMRTKGSAELGLADPVEFRAR